MTEEVTNSLEKETGQIGEMQIEEKLVSVEPKGEAVIVGDVHGDLESLVHILEDSSFIERVREQENIFLIFLGDYGDRGPYSAEVYHITLRLKHQFPRNVILMRGNHEGPEDLLAHPHDLPSQFQRRFGSDGDSAYSRIRKLFSQLITSVLVKDRYILIHGGFPTQARSLNDLAYAQKTHPKKPFLEEMLWNDPEENVKGTASSPRGAGKLFGIDVTEAFLKRFRVSALIRGHEPATGGFKLNHNGKVLTLFSRKGEPYYNQNGAYLRVDLSIKTKNAEELLKWIHQF